MFELLFFCLVTFEQDASNEIRMRHKLFQQHL
jgi:hypothetical protein